MEEDYKKYSQNRQDSENLMYMSKIQCEKCKLEYRYYGNQTKALKCCSMCGYIICIQCMKKCDVSNSRFNDNEKKWLLTNKWNTQNLSRCPYCNYLIKNV